MLPRSRSPQRDRNSASGASPSHDLLLQQLRAIEHGRLPGSPAATALAIGAGRPLALNLALAVLIFAVLFGLSGSAPGTASGAAPRLNVVSLNRAADGTLLVQAAPSGPPRGVPLLAGAPSIPRGGQPTWIAAPELGIDAPVQEAGLIVKGGVPTWEVLPNVVAHYSGSATLGANSNVVLAGHFNTPFSAQGAVFRKLPQSKVGQVITVF